MFELNQNEVQEVSGGIIPVILVCLLLSGCATMNGPNNENLKKDQ